MTYYDILGVSRNANCAEIKKAYRALVKQYHPDITHKDTSEKFKRITEIYNILVNPDSRKLYDDQLKSTVEKLNEQVASIKISVSESIYGTKKTFPYYYNMECKCGTRRIPCFTCKGKGFVRGLGDRISTCPTCEGHKFENPNGCRLCFGSGEIRKYASELISIPPGVDDGYIKNQITEHGGVIPVRINIEKTSDDLYYRKGSDLVYKTSVDPITALIGGVIKIPTLEGNIDLTIKENSSNKQIYKIPRGGVPNKNGDLYVYIDINYNLTDLSLIPKIRSVVRNGECRMH